MTMQMFELPAELIPPQLQKIAQDCGQQTAMILLLNYPGVHVHIPTVPLATHKLAELLGVEAFALLCSLYGGNNISMPRGAKALRSARNQQILRSFSEGLNQSVIALKFGLTERHINTICNTVRIDYQRDLFSL